MTIIDLTKDARTDSADPPAAPVDREQAGDTGRPEPIVVDQPDEPVDLSTRLGVWAARERRPVLPPWLRSRADLAQSARMAAQLTGSAAAYHALRAPWYVLRAGAYAPRGAVRTVRRGWEWAADAESAPLRRAERDKRGTELYLKLQADHARVVRAHLPATLAVLAAVAAAVLFVLYGLSEPAQYLAAATLVALLGWLGQPADKPIVTRHAVGDQMATKPTSETVEKALRSIGIAALSAKDAKLDFPHPIRQDGPGWRADVDLPHGVTAIDVIERRAPLASGLRRPLGCVWPEADHDAHAGRLVIWVAMQDMAKSRPAPYPLRKSGVVDYFASIPFGVDQRRRPVSVPLAESNLLVGSLPGGGKTAGVRCILAGCSLDPTIELHIWELKGSGDLESFERIAHSYGSGVDDETIEGAAAGLRWLRAEVGRRAERVKELRRRSRDLVPDSKVTRELANRRHLGLHPIVFVIDEAQELFTHPDVGKQAGQDAEKVIKRGRAFGVYLMLATQRPDKDSLPTGVSANVGTRFCLRVMGQVENDMILGTSSYKNGLRATTLRPSDKGIGWLVGASDTPTVVRTYYLDAAATDAIVARAYVLRERAGLLTGMAAGETVDFGETVDVLADLGRIFATAEVLHTEDVLARLGELRPQIYGAWAPEQLASSVRPLGIRPGQVSIGGKNRQGYRRAAILEAAANRALEG